ncbi:Sensory protein containing PAS HAMP and Methyl-accepting chemotaxis-like domain [Methanonatronarchaeum thermophilum]|uniref:Sensory protein containing PAS HAMP and Methyl-accepting chemotaxis-like domain n=1 Tax=Methanonatronarchaeum thermophilum TaxID=1927129 RepID=A0A1Y3GGB1_9EURY|nr:methyl-accepting chemotaxis protein [Methanonatronarchaeum thermophilum]OUJ19353.1 Sensory protein containing PAS HAMP and Methyl-accepting chemotaxis-like domain [Methanonatronarchaeum thermophilum]
MLEKILSILGVKSFASQSEVKSVQSKSDVDESNYLESIPKTVLAIDKDFNVDYINPSGAKKLGMEPEECIGKKCYNLLETEHCNSENCAPKRAMESGEDVTDENVWHPSPTKQIPIKYTGAPVRNDDGEIVGAVEYAENITDRKLKEKEINALFQKAPVPMFMVDPDHKITRWNNKMAEYIDCSKEEAVGKKFPEISGGHESVADKAIEKRQEVTEARDNVEVRGDLYHVISTAVPIKDNDGNLTGAVQVINDITETKEKLKELKAIQEYWNTINDEYERVFEKFEQLDMSVRLETPEPEKDLDILIEAFEADKSLHEDINKGLDAIQDALSEAKESAMKFTEDSESMSASTEELASSIDQISASGQQIGSGIDDQVEKSEVMKNNISNLSSSIQEITSAAQQINSETDNATKISKEGVEAAEGAIDKIYHLDEVTDKNVENIRELEEKMAEVSEITDVISNIAEQTNLLALNANIEAARAGEKGQGFAVVANEVKSLAEDSQESAQEIEEIIREVQEFTNENAKLIEETNKEVEESIKAVQKGANSLEEIQEMVEEISQGIDEIAEATESQAHNTSEVSEVAEEASALSQEISAAIQQINSSVEEQNEAVQEIAEIAQDTLERADSNRETLEEFKLE